MATKPGTAYYLRDTERRLTPSQLSKASRQTQIEVMKEWFFTQFMHPDNLPYDSEEGGYQYIWGGPYEAKDELEAEFGGTASESSINELAEELDRQSFEWSANQDLYPPDEDYFAESEPYEQSPCQVMCLHLDVALLLLKNSLPPGLRSTLVQLAFANAITSLEVYLGSLFGTMIKGNQVCLMRFIETNPDFKDQKFSLSEVFEVSKTIERRVSGYLSNVVWHNLAKVEHMYKSTFKISFPQESKKDLLKAVADRHHIVHRNGLDNAGEVQFWCEDDVRALVRKIKDFAIELETQLGRTPCGLAKQDIDQGEFF